MAQSSIQKDDWVSRSEKFARQEAQMLKILNVADKPLNVIELLQRFLDWYRYLPVGFERRLRHLEEQKYIIRHGGSVATYELSKG